MHIWIIRLAKLISTRQKVNISIVVISQPSLYVFAKEQYPEGQKCPPSWRDRPPTVMAAPDFI